MSENRIDRVFTDLKSKNRRALIPFLTAGDPDLETTGRLIVELLARGADLVEIGIPYSDPIADGPVISASYNRALAKHVHLDDIFLMIERLRASGVGAPLVMMVSHAIVHRRGPARYIEDASRVGVDGLIIPDLPIEESEEIAGLVRARGLRLIHLVTPTTPRERAARIARASTGFLYYVSVAGITGERSGLPHDLVENVEQLRAQAIAPICVGFGISSPEQVRSLAPIADGVIVGSALVRRIAEAAETGEAPETMVRRIGDFIASLKEAL